MKQLPPPRFLTSSTTLIYLRSYFVFNKVCLKQRNRFVLIYSRINLYFGVTEIPAVMKWLSYQLWLRRFKDKSNK